MRRRMSKIVSLCLLMLCSLQLQAQENPDPCGPAASLSEELSTNVAENSRCFELRFYTAASAVDGEGGVDNLHQRFREKQQSLLEQNGAELLGYWQRLDNPNTIVWLLAFDSREHRDEVFRVFRADPEWLALREKYNVPLENRELFFMSATDYSKIQ